MGFGICLFHTILKTTDGGINWISKYSGTTYLSFKSVYFSDPDTGWVVGFDGVILKTTDGGDKWIPQTSGTIWDLYSVYFTDSNNGWAVGEHSKSVLHGIILKTSDGGNNWISLSSGTREWLQSVYFIDSNTGWVVGSGGTILKTTNGGEN